MRVIVAISGVSYGLGAALLKNLREDYTVIGFGRSIHGYIHTDDCVVFPGDVMDEEGSGWSQCFELSQSHWGQPPDILINNAGINHISYARDLREDQVREIISTNVCGSIFGIMQMAKAHDLVSGDQRGFWPKRIINIGSVAGRIAMRATLAYCASKGAVNMITRQAARELAPGCIVFGINPGRLKDTHMGDQVDEQVMRVRDWSKLEADRYQMSQIPLCRYGELSEVVDLVRYLLKAPSYMTGSIIEIAGGQ